MSNIKGLNYPTGINLLPSGYPRLPTGKSEHVTKFKATTMICMQRNEPTPKNPHKVSAPTPSALKI